MFKKILALLLAATVIGAALASCGGNGNNEDTTDTDNTTDTESTEDTGNAPAANVALEDITAAVKGAYDGLYDPTNEMGMPLTPIDEVTLKDLFGIDSAWVAEYAAEMPMMMTNVDTFIIVKPTEGNAQNVIDALNSYQDFQVNESMQYPMNIQKVRAAQIFEKGGYVFFIRLGTLSDDALYAEGTEEEINTIQYNEAMANNQKAIDAINALFGE